MESTAQIPSAEARKRSGWVTGAIVMQILWAVTLVGLPVYLLFLARSAAIQHGPDASDAAHGLRIGAAVVAVPGLFAIVSSYGLWKEKLWGWWLALTANVGMFAVLVYSMTDENTIDWDMVVLTVISAVLPILLVLPVVRRFYWKGTI
jgi:hypothetical protein